MMERFVLTDAQWAKMEPHCLGKKSDPGRSGGDNRLFVEAVLGIARTGSPWRDLPASFGKWNSVFRRYRDWVKADVSARLFAACLDEPDMEYAMVDAAIVKSRPRPRSPRRQHGRRWAKVHRCRGALVRCRRTAWLCGP